jgi:tetratricopeptide (TPR) repeat protein
MRVQAPFAITISVAWIVLFTGTGESLRGQELNRNKQEAPPTVFRQDAQQDLIRLQSDLASATSSNRKKDAADDLSQIGITHYRSANILEALNVFEKALELYRQAGDEKGQATAISEIAMCHSAVGEKHRALDYLDKALPIWREIGDRDDEASTLGKKGDIYRAWGYPAEAMHFYKEALPAFLVAGDRAGVQLCSIILASPFSTCTKIGKRSNGSKKHSFSINRSTTSMGKSRRWSTLERLTTLCMTVHGRLKCSTRLLKRLGRITISGLRRPSATELVWLTRI